MLWHPWWRDEARQPVQQLQRRQDQPGPAVERGFAQALHQVLVIRHDTDLASMLVEQKTEVLATEAHEARGLGSDQPSSGPRNWVISTSRSGKRATSFNSAPSDRKSRRNVLTRTSR